MTFSAPLQMTIGQISQKEITPEIKELLLLADPDWGKIKRYLYDSDIYVLKHTQEIIGVLVLKHTEEFSTEIMNVAVKEEYQGKGFGKKLLEESEKIARAQKSKYLEIGTGNSSINQISLYQKFGFRIDRVIKDYFKSYDKEIIENGIRCMDMIKFRKNL